LKHRDEVHAYRRQRRAKSRGVRVEPYTAQDLGDRLKLFGGKCAYCQQLLDSAGEPHWDHVVPILRNGVDGLSNLVPSCKHCNCRKWAHDAYAWYSRQPFFSREQWQLINEACSYPSEHQQKPISE
jgi:5-methylcytosine-specific restriction endonuclease McrA